MADGPVNILSSDTEFLEASVQFSLKVTHAPAEIYNRGDAPGAFDCSLRDIRDGLCMGTCKPGRVVFSALTHVNKAGNKERIDALIHEVFYMTMCDFYRKTGFRKNILNTQLHNLLIR